MWEWRFVDELCWKKLPYPGDFGDRLKNGFEPVYHFSIESPKICFSNIAESREVITNAYASALPDSQGTTKKRANKKISHVLPDNVIETGNDSMGIDGGGHSARFTVALVEFFIKAYSDAGDTWLDPFLGSGTTIVAAHKNQRRGLGIEMLEKYCAVICERMSLLGLTPKRIESGDKVNGTKKLGANTEARVTAAGASRRSDTTKRGRQAQTKAAPQKQNTSRRPLAVDSGT